MIDKELLLLYIRDNPCDYWNYHFIKILSINEIYDTDGVKGWFSFTTEVKRQNHYASINLNGGVIEKYIKWKNKWVNREKKIKRILK